MATQKVTIQEKFLRLSERKARLAVDLIRGKFATEAERILQFTPTKSARIVLKALKAGISAAKAKGMATKDTKVVTALADGGPALKRGLAVSRGTWHPIKKRTTHLTITLEAPEKVVMPKVEVSQAKPKAEGGAVSTKKVKYGTKN
ncbi:MAG: 50S ribosomal protein L22 [bacterium]|nr:50S ribosomal protein L22 [bacterium]